jgi:hypothetical protein
VKTRLVCHSEESATPIGGRRGISHCVENTQSEIPRPAAQSRLRATGRSARNDKVDGVFTQSGVSKQRVFANNDLGEAREAFESNRHGFILSGNVMPAVSR